MVCRRASHSDAAAILGSFELTNNSVSSGSVARCGPDPRLVSRIIVANFFTNLEAVLVY